MQRGRAESPARAAPSATRPECPVPRIRRLAGSSTRCGRDCFEPGLAFLPLGSIVVCCEGFAAPPAAVEEAAERFFTDFDIEILQSVKAASTPHHRSPTSGRRGRTRSALSARNCRHYRSNPRGMPVLSGSCCCPVWGALEHGMIKEFRASTGEVARPMPRGVSFGHPSKLTRTNPRNLARLAAFDSFH